MSRIRKVEMLDIPKFQSHDVRYLYAIAEVDDVRTVKIGRAAHPFWRMSDLQVGNHRRLTLLCSWAGSRDEIKAVERYLHNLFEPRRVAGEWFRVSVKDIDDALAAVAK